ncbi:MAG TPA: sigma-54 dependent transcriptional regulator [bacterium]
MARALVVDDDPATLKALELLLAKAGHEVTAADRGERALALVDEREFDIVVTDLRIGDASGLDVLTRVKQRSPATSVVVITGFASIESAVEAIKLGAYDYLTKPLFSDKVRIVVKRALERAALTREVDHLRRELTQHFSFETLVAKSARMQEIFEIIKQTASSDSNVLITGESGTGKELVARAIHYNSPRRERRFVPVNCGALSRELIEAELFGYVKGAFTGAAKDKGGFLELAAWGTLFLDEIAETTPDFQVKLLRVIQEGEFHKVGSPHPTKADIRILAATNRDLRRGLADGSFREDLFYRLNVISIHLPPLRERREDIPMLVVHFLQKFAAKRADGRVVGIAPAALETLIAYPFPGNVRELENAIEYAVAFARGSEIQVADLPPALREARGKPHAFAFKPLKAARHEFEQQFVRAALQECGGNISKTARLLNMHRQGLQQKMKELGIAVDGLRED